CFPSRRTGRHSTTSASPAYRPRTSTRSSTTTPRYSWAWITERGPGCCARLVAPPVWRGALRTVLSAVQDASGDATASDHELLLRRGHERQRPSHAGGAAHRAHEGSTGIHLSRMGTGGPDGS